MRANFKADSLKRQLLSSKILVNLLFKSIYFFPFHSQAQGADPSLKDLLQLHLSGLNDCCPAHHLLTSAGCLPQWWRISTFQSPFHTVLQKCISAAQDSVSEYPQPGFYNFPCSWARLLPWPCTSLSPLSLQSAWFFAVPARNLATVGARAFPTAASAIWNSLLISHCFIAPLYLFKSLVFFLIYYYIILLFPTALTYFLTL